MIILIEIGHLVVARFIADTRFIEARAQSTPLLLIGPAVMCCVEAAVCGCGGEGALTTMRPVLRVRRFDFISVKGHYGW